MAPSTKSGGELVPPEDILKYVEILKRHGITDQISEVILKDPGSCGEGFASQRMYVTVKFENPLQAPLQLFAKMQTNNPLYREMLKETKAFEKEKRFFTQYFPEVRHLCEEKGVLELINIYPKCYHADDNLVVLENLVLDKGYGMHDTDEMMGLEETETALLTLAKHHAISHALIENHGGRKGFLEKFKDFDFDSYVHTREKEKYRSLMEPMLVTGITNHRKILEKFNANGRELALERIKANTESIFDLMIEPLLYNHEEDPITVLSHGDYWKNNMMFLRDKTGKILHQKTLDFQVVRLNSPGLDLGYFLYTSVKPEVILSHLIPLLKLYHQNLLKVSSDLDHPIEITFEQVFLDFRRKLKHGFWLGFPLSSGPGTGAMKDFDVNDLMDISDFGEHYEKAVDKWTEENPEKCEIAVNNIIGLMDQYYELKID